MIVEAERASRHLCQICGSAGTIQAAPRLATLCSRHAGEALAPSVSAVAPTSPEPIRPRRRAEQVASPVSYDTSALSQLSMPGPDATAGDAFARGGERDEVAIYRLSDVADALGHAPDGGEGGSDDPETSHGALLRRILNQGEDATWRGVIRPDHAQVAGLDALDRQAPHFGEVTDLVRRHLRAAIAMGMPTTLPAIMLLGEPGFGKSWYVGRLAALLALPVRSHPMNSTTLGDGLMGSHPVWRNACPGLVARTLLSERVANPVFLVDEFDKPASYSREDPYRAFYTVLEPEGARALVDEYLGFALDASHVSWILAGNSIDRVPAPIVDRLTVLNVPAMSQAQRRAVAASVYAEGNAARHGFFDPAPSDDVVDRLAPMTPRGMRRALGEAMVRAAADGRRVLEPDDVVIDARPTRRRIGF